MAAIQNPQLLKKVDTREGRRDGRESTVDASDDSNVLNIIARALVARRAAIRDDEDEDQGDAWD